MADSHGQPDTIAAAADYLKALTCTHLIHLGDICDSLRPETARACIDVIQAHQITALKGNNDHNLSSNLMDRQGRLGSSAEGAYLRSLPVIHRYANAVFTHSRPFVAELGPVSLIGSMDTLDARRFFTAEPNAVLFRGHAHAPGIMWLAAHDVVAQPLMPQETIDLSAKLPCVITCGALTHGFCMVWHPRTNRLECHAFMERDDPRPKR